jgi:hypothetical protein
LKRLLGAATGGCSPVRPSEAKPRLIDGHRRVILPQEVLDALGAHEGDYVSFAIQGKDVRLLKVKWVPAGS